MKTTSKILCALLVLTMVFAMFSVSASAEATQITPTDGKPTDIVGIPAGATVTYLSDEGVELVDFRTHYQGAPKANNAGDIVSHQKDTSFYINAASVYCFAEGIRGSAQSGDDKSKIFLGYNGTEYTKGLGVFAGSAKAEYTYHDNYLTFAIPTGATRFYAVAGVNGNNSTTEKYGPIRFEVWGGNSKDGTFTQLAYAEVSTYHTAEFDVDISGYTYIKLVHMQAATASGAGSGLDCVWANAAVYAMPAAAEPDVKNNVAFESALSMLTAWKESALNAEPSQVSCTFKNNTTTSSVYTDAEGNYIGMLTGIAAKEMAETVSMYLVNASGDPVTETVSTSIRDYAIKYMNEGPDADYKVVAGSMLDYGAAAQTYFGYNTGALANADAPAYAELNYENIIADMDDVRGATVGAEHFYATNLRLEDEVELMFYFQGLEAGCKYQFTWDGGSTEKQNVPAGELAKVVLDTLPVKDFAKTVTCTVYDANDNVVVTATDSVASYALRAIQNDTNSKDVCIELLEYATAVSNYMAK